MTPLQADSFADALGINTHVNWWDARRGEGSAWADLAVVADAVSDLGCRHLRDFFPLEVTRGTAVIEVHERCGARFSLATPLAADASAVVDAARVYGRAVEALEGCNEPDIMPDLGPPQAVRAWQQALAQEVRPQLPGMELLGTPMCHPHNASLYGDMQAWMDVGNLHVYVLREPYTPEALMRQWTDHKASFGELPLRVTETGYSSTGVHLRVSDRASAAYIPATLLTNLAAGVERTYVYELLDEDRTVPEEEYGQNGFGLLTDRLEPKGSYLAVRHLMRLLADPGPDFAVTPIDVTVEGDVQSLLFERRDGTHLLALWRCDPLYDPDTMDDLHPQPVVVKVGWGPVRAVTIHPIGEEGRETDPVLGSYVSIEVPAEAARVVDLAPLSL